MSDTEKPQDPVPAPPTETPAAPINPPAAATGNPSSPPAPAAKPEKKPGRRPFSQGPKKPRILEPVSLEDEKRFSSSPSLKDLDAEIEAEMQATMHGLSDKDMYGEQQNRGTKPPEDTGRKTGKVISVHGPDVFVEVPGGRSQGLLPILQFPEGPPKIGTEVEIQIEGYDRANGLLILTRRGAAVVADWTSIAEGMVVEARVTETNKGGLAVDVNGIRGFMPISQIDMYRVENADQFVNQRLLCLVTEVNPQERNLVVSRRALLEKEREEHKEKLWQELAEGQVRDGIVRSVRDFGAFVDLGGADGLLHISEMSWARVQDASSVVQPGQAIKVVVLKLDKEKRKISLGLRQLLPSPWDQIEEKYHMHKVIAGKVTRLMEFGAFVELEPGIEGLVHISEVSSQRVHRVGDFLQPGQDVQVMVMKVGPEERKISLSIKAALAVSAPPTEEEEVEEDVEIKPIKPRTTPLRGGVGGDWTLPEK